VYPVCSLDAIARDAADGEPILVVTDARRREVYWAAYDGGGRRIAGPAVQSPAALAQHLPETGARQIAGRGGAMYADVLGLPVRQPEYPSPRGLVAVAQEVLLAAATPEPLTPLYLRRPDAVAPGVPKKVAR
jgi:tRNA threonylcarbamoyl adenosine modification protein YeaZ